MIQTEQLKGRLQEKRSGVKGTGSLVLEAHSEILASKELNRKLMEDFGLI